MSENINGNVAAPRKVLSANVRRRAETEDAGGGSKQFNRRRPGPATMQSVISPDNKEHMLAVLVRNRQAFDVVHTLLRPSHFDATDREHRLLWKIACDHFAANGTLPEKFQFLTAIDAACADSPGTLIEHEQDNLIVLVNFIFAPDTFQRPVETDTVYAEWALRCAKRFLHERLSRRTQAAVATGEGKEAMIAVDLPGALEGLRNEALRIESLSARGPNLAFEDGWERTIGIHTYSTGLAMFDHFIAGGHAPGEVYGLLGPTGVGKTLLGCMLAAASAQYFHALASQPGYNDKPQLAFILSYEASKSELRQRVLSYAAQVSKNSWPRPGVAMADALSHTGALKEYELRLFRDQLARGEEVMGEYERVQAILPAMQRHLVLVDFSGGDPKFRGCGGGGIDEIASIVAAELRTELRASSRCGVLLVDYVGTMVESQIAEQNLSNDEYNAKVGAAPMHAKRRLAGPLQTPVWLLHQLSGVANNYGPTKAPRYTDAKGNKSFANALDFSFQLGVPQDYGQHDRLALLSKGKSRRTGPQEPMIVSIDGEMARMENADRTYRVNHAVHRIVPHRDDRNTPASARGPSTGNPANIDPTFD